MRSFLFCLLLVGCTDAADVATTVVHVHLSATCATPECSTASEVFVHDCGPLGTTAVTATTRSVEVQTSDDAKDIAAYVQLQYTSDQDPRSASEVTYWDQVLRANQTADVYSAYDYTLLYRLTAAGEAIDVANDKLMATNGATLTFAYDADGVAAVEDHQIDAPKDVRVETDEPGITDACCSAGGARDGGLVAIMIVGGLRLGRRRAR
jgi:hypothetical protein